MTVPSQWGERLRTEGAGAPGCWQVTAGGPLSSPPFKLLGWPSTLSSDGE